MNDKISKTNQQEAFFNALLDEVQMNGTARIRAKASLAQADAFADAVVGLLDLVKRLLQSLVLRPYRRLTTTLG